MAHNHDGVEERSPGSRVRPPVRDRLAILEPERQQDPDRNGVAVIIDVDSVAGANANGFFQQTRA